MMIRREFLKMLGLGALLAPVVPFIKLPETKDIIDVEAIVPDIDPNYIPVGQGIYRVNATAADASTGKIDIKFYEGDRW